MSAKVLLAKELSPIQIPDAPTQCEICGLKVSGFDPDMGGPQYNNGMSNLWTGGLSVQYSMRYLQSQVKDFGLPEFVNRLTPVVELAWSSSASRPTQTTTQYPTGAGAFSQPSNRVRPPFATVA